MVSVKVGLIFDNSSPDRNDTRVELVDRSPDNNDTRVELVDRSPDIKDTRVELVDRSRHTDHLVALKSSEDMYIVQCITYMYM